MASEGSAVLRSQELNLVLGPMGFQLRELAGKTLQYIHKEQKRGKRRMQKSRKKRGTKKDTHSIAQAGGKDIINKSFCQLLCILVQSKSL